MNAHQRRVARRALARHDMVEVLPGWLLPRAQWERLTFVDPPPPGPAVVRLQKQLEAWAQPGYIITCTA